MIGEVRQLFRNGVLHISKTHSIILLVDALDEAGETEARQIVEGLKQLMARPNNGSDDCGGLRVCFSCRHYPQISLDGGKTLVVEDGNNDDIQKVITTQIDGAGRMDASEKEKIKSDIISASKGSFQWASLVCDTIIRRREKGSSFEAAFETMRHAPKDLDLLYTALIELREMDDEEGERLEILKVFQWVLFAREPLNPRELQHALALDCNMTETSISEYQGSRGFTDDADFEIRVQNLSRGLIMFRSHPHSKCTEFIHQSVSDFLLRKGLRLLACSTALDSHRLAHYQLSRSCLKYFVMKEIAHFVLEESGERIYLMHSVAKERFPFLAYASHYWKVHIIKARNQNDSTNDSSDDDILEFFQWPNEEVFLLIL